MVNKIQNIILQVSFNGVLLKIFCFLHSPALRKNYTNFCYKIQVQLHSSSKPFCAYKVDFSTIGHLFLDR